MLAIESIEEDVKSSESEIFLLTRSGSQAILRADIRTRTSNERPPLRRPFVRDGRLAVRIEGAKDSRGRKRVDSNGCIAAAPEMLSVILDATLFAQSNAPVLLEGETGVGKEILARWIHENSPRHDAPWEAINCATLTRDLADSELFGHEAGAFTGASRRHVGLLERAGRGTVLLDELGELSPAVQAQLLRALETGEFRRVGGERMLPLRARILAATHRDLVGAAHTGAFRADLLHRLGVLRLRIPPLRDRLEDIPWLAKAMAETLPDPLCLSPTFTERLLHHAWPGNVRELRNVLIRAAVLGGEPTLPSSVPVMSRSEDAPAPSGRLEREGDEAILQELIRQRGHRGRTHRSLGIPRSTFYRWMQTHRRQVESALATALAPMCGG